MASRRDPSFKVLLREMQSRDALKAEGAFHLLLPRAGEHIEDLISAFESEQPQGVRCWLLELIGEARTERAFRLLCENAVSEDEALRRWSVRGLQLLKTPAARNFLWQNGLAAE
jgi:HEAT repeat protein